MDQVVRLKRQFHSVSGFASDRIDLVAGSVHFVPRRIVDSGSGGDATAVVSLGNVGYSVQDERPSYLISSRLMETR